MSVETLSYKSLIRTTVALPSLRRSELVKRLSPVKIAVAVRLRPIVLTVSLPSLLHTV